MVLKKIWEKNWKKIFLRGGGGGGCLIMAMSTDTFWGGHFSVEPGIFLSNRAFFCRTMHFAVEPGFFLSDECYNVSWLLKNDSNILSFYVLIGFGQWYLMWVCQSDAEHHRHRLLLRSQSCSGGRCYFGAPVEWWLLKGLLNNAVSGVPQGNPLMATIFAQWN